jgi:hypothetical protein
MFGHSSTRTTVVMLSACLALASLLLLNACQPGAETASPSPLAAEATSTQASPPTTTPSPVPTVTPPPTPTPANQAIITAYASGPHAALYDLGKGPNTYCARCHSPANWDPAATIGEQPNCVSCKFAFEDSPRIAESNPLIAPEDWNGIRCKDCHAAEDTLIQGDLVWTNMATGEHEVGMTVNTLCEKCHADTETLRHRRDLGDSAHLDYVCTDCHESHTMAASCTEAGCHPDAVAGASAVPGHDTDHAAVSCVACHDAAGLEVGPVEGSDTWAAFRTVELLGRSTTSPYQSHDLQRTVDCGRCHYSDNPWGLEVVELPVP